MRILSFVFLLFSLQVHANIDSLKTEFINAQEDSLKLDLLNSLIQEQLWNHTDSAYVYAEKYLEIAKKIEDPQLIGRGENFKGLCHHVKGEYDKAIQYYFRAVPLFEKAGDTLFAGILNNNIGVCYQSRQDYERAKEYYRSALENFIVVGDEEWKNNMYTNLATLHNALNEYDEAIDYNLKVLDYAELKKDDHLKGTILSNLCGVYFNTGKFQKSIDYGLQSIEFIDTLKDVTVWMVSKTNTGMAYIRTGKYSEAIDHLTESLELSQRYNALEREQKGYEGLSEAYAAMNRHRIALEYYKKSEVIKDSLFNEARDRAIAEANTKYETEKKQQQIENLELTNSLQELKLDQSRKRNAAMIIGLLLLVAIAGLLFNAYRMKKKSLEEKELLLREIHHRVKNNLQIVSSLLNIQQREISDEKASQAIQESKNRVESMGLIHQSLYRNRDLGNIGVREYVEELVDGIMHSYPLKRDQIKYNLRVEDLQLDMDTLIPLGLIINELINNSLKHAFPDRDEGAITLELKKQDDNVHLMIEDDGKGFNDVSDLEQNSSFGFKMIKAFVKKLNAKMESFGDQGSRFLIRFKMV